MASRRKAILPWVMRLFAVLQVLTGVGFIIYACILESPPKTAIPIGLVIVGVIAILSFFVGFVGSFYKRWCLSVYLMLGTLVTLAELGIVLTLFFNLGGVVDNMWSYAYNQDATEDDQFLAEKQAQKSGGEPYQYWDWPDKSQVTTALEAGRWVFLVVIVLQLAGLVVAVSMRTCCYHEGDDYEDFEAQQAEEAAKATDKTLRAQIQMEDLKNSIGGRSSGKSMDPNSTFYASSSKLYKTVTKRMASKYGDFTHDGSFQKSWWARLWGR